VAKKSHLLALKLAFFCCPAYYALDQHFNIRLFSAHIDFTMLHKATINFLASLKKNNNRDWFQANKPAFTAAKENFEETVQDLLDKLAQFDPEMKGTVAKDCLFRIYRDVRFSKNKEPYKTNFGASMGPGGRKSLVTGYYFHLGPGDSMIAGGLYMPQSAQLKAVRQEIDYNLEAFEALLSDKMFKKVWGQLEGEKLKSAPRGYAKDNPAIEYLRHKSFIVHRPIADKDLLSKNLTTKMAKHFESLLPLKSFFNKVISEV